MNSAEIGGIVRAIAAFGFGFLVKAGVIDGEQATQLAGAVGTVAIIVWSIRSKRTAA